MIYELHVRDFSILPESGIPFGGKYLGLAARGALCDGQPTGLDHLVELGVTHVHLMPVQDFASIDEKDPSAYNWGYDPYHYFVPEGSYSLFPDSPTARITEFKRMVLRTARAGLRVVMDVYNRTYTAADNPLNMMAPGYYYRTRRGQAGQRVGVRTRSLWNGTRLQARYFDLACDTRSRSTMWDGSGSI